MPLKKYQITNQFTGETTIVERDKPPSTKEIDSIFSSLPKPPEPEPVQVAAAPEKKLGWAGRVAQPFKELPGKYAESYEAAKNAPVTPGAELPAAIGRAGGVVAEGVINPIGATLSSLDQAAGGVPGRVIGGALGGLSRLGTAAGMEKVGSAFARTGVGKELYKIGTDPEQAQNLRAGGALSTFLGMGIGKKAIAEAAEKGLIGQKTPEALIKATAKKPATEALVRRLPAAYAEKFPTIAEGLKGLSEKLVKYGLEKHVDPLRFNPRKLESEAHDLYNNAVKRADESLFKSAREGVFETPTKGKGLPLKKVDIMDAFDQAILEEAEKGTKGVLSEEFPTAWKQVDHLRKVYAKEWSGLKPVEEALEFKRKVLDNKDLFKNSAGISSEDPISVSIKKAVRRKLNEKFAEISPEFKKYNNIANDLASIQEAAEKIVTKTGEAPNWATIGGQIKSAVGPVLQKTVKGEIPLTKEIAAGIGNVTYPGMTRWSIKDLLKGKIATEAPPAYGVSYSEPLRKEIETYIVHPYVSGKSIIKIKPSITQIRRNK